LVSVTTISFDISMLELFLPLIVGAKLILARAPEMADGAALLSLLQRHSATFMQATPVTWQLLLEAGWHGHPPLKMLCGGEAMPRKLAETLLKCGGELWNMYGPTETTVWSSALRVESGDGPVLIGPPIANTQFYILDDRQEPVPHGVPGELFIGGDGVALGYFDLPEVTAEKFILDKFREVPNAKLYRTGDMVRMRDHERMEYLGRTDHQIKLRGFRIELGEIEAALLRYPGIEEAVSILGQDASGEGAIWAYVVPRRAGVKQSDALVGALGLSVSQSLPSYMCPSSIVVLDAMPRTPNGKIDRRSLPAPAPVQRQSRVAAQPLNETERRVANIWSSVLGVEAIDKTADFFELGGHSLLAARLLARIEAEFGQRLSLLTLFEAPNIEAQAKLFMHGGQREYDFRQVVRLQPGGSKPPLIAIHNTGVYYYNLSKRLGPDQPLTALQLFDPSIARQSLPQTLEDLAAEYVRLILRFQATGPYKLIGWSAGGVLAFEVARQLVATGRGVSLLAMIDTWAPGHNRRLSRLRAILADYSYRWQLIAADWRRVISREQNLAAFLAQRTFSKRLLRWFGRPPQGDEQARVPFEARGSSAENYDQWLLGYLEEAELGYEPKIYPGKITLLCSAQEPKGPFLDPLKGWGAFASGGVDVAVIDGDHFTMFKGQGLEQMATHISAVIDVYDNRRSPHAAGA
jgi:thioesterase domain-containing protein/acyl carrier protein